MAYTKATRDGALPPAKIYHSTDVEIVNGLDVSSFLAELAQDYHRGNYNSIISNWFRKWGFDSRRDVINSLLQVVRTIREHSNDLMEYQAHLITQKQVLFEICKGKVIEAQFMIDRIEKDHELYIGTANHQMQMMTLSAEKMKSAIRLDNAKAGQEEARAKLMYWAVDNLNTLPPPLQAYIISSVFNPGGQQAEDFEMQERLKEYRIKEVEAEADNKRHQARKEGYSADQEQTKARQAEYARRKSQKDFDEI